MDIQRQIIEAIKSRRQVEINYKGEGFRMVCPHALYISSTGKTLVDSYQVSGYSNHSEQIPDWRPFDILKITELKVLDETFELAPGYNPSSDRYSNAIAMI
jgi:predicted DNA-binding transcriptional regulator YafY